MKMVRLKLWFGSEKRSVDLLNCGYLCHLPPLNFRGRPRDSQQQGVWEEGSGSCFVGESVGGWWFGRGPAVWEELHLGFQHGRPWAPEPDGWILYPFPLKSLQY